MLLYAFFVRNFTYTDEYKKIIETETSHLFPNKRV